MDNQSFEEMKKHLAKHHDVLVSLIDYIDKLTNNIFYLQGKINELKGKSQ